MMPMPAAITGGPTAGTEGPAERGQSLARSTRGVRSQEMYAAWGWRTWLPTALPPALSLGASLALWCPVAPLCVACPWAACAHQGDLQPRIVRDWHEGGEIGLVCVTTPSAGPSASDATPSCRRPVWITRARARPTMGARARGAPGEQWGHWSEGGID